MVPSSDYASIEVCFSRAESGGLRGVCSAFEEVHRLHFAMSFGIVLLHLASSLPYQIYLLQAFDKLRYGLLCRGVKLQKALDEGKSLSFLSKEKEVESMHLRYEAYRRSN